MEGNLPEKFTLFPALPLGVIHNVAQNVSQKCSSNMFAALNNNYSPITAMGYNMILTQLSPSTITQFLSLMMSSTVPCLPLSLPISISTCKGCEK